MHLKSSETVVILRGRVLWIFYDENGAVTESVVLDADGDVRCINVERDRWHSLECMASGTILMECKDKAYRPLVEDEIMDV